MELRVDRVLNEDCVDGMRKLPASVADLVFADPPFNVGFGYDDYDDSRSEGDYLGWCRRWIGQVRRVLKPTGVFWLASGDKYAAELKIVSQETGFVCRDWVVWHYTFGLHCSKSFSRSHTHLFHFVKNPKRFTFNADAIREPSKRQTVYNDPRANPKGRLPDDVWSIPRLCGTHRERRGFHPCQMPESVLRRIVTVSSNPGELVLDPFSGSGTTLAVAKRLGRRFLGFERSVDYCQGIQVRLEEVSREM